MRVDLQLVDGWAGDVDLDGDIGWRIYPEVEVAFSADFVDVSDVEAGVGLEAALEILAWSSPSFRSR